ncbi:hypothetical protein PV325_003420 [Microctonus aethiopoides]|uniref:Tyrosine specific protein phosphatases domain-containing protein n=1 Tax=Microctonus aethiopoides TaxID=144406 RepID=A0AA39C9P3_9HYME|nr:hypothetical protein PV325_003420 [Microctonus aethiopoides]KAK0160368.1 hypothetical protein PV328_007784 [Microctonus aethiopoides]
MIRFLKERRITRILRGNRTPGVCCDRILDHQIAAILPRVFVGTQDSALCLDILKHHKFKHILNHGINPSINFNTSIKCYYMKILHIPEFGLNALFRSCIKMMNAHRNENILIHCHVGVSRSLTIINGYLMTQEKLTYDKTYHKIK